MQTSQVILIIIILFVITGIGYVVTQDNAGPTPTAQDTGTSQAQQDDENYETATDERADTQAGESGVYRDYDPTLVAQSNAEHTVLFFHASWCPSCRALENDIQANREEIPPDVAIYKVDYDTATELKQRYGITVQHSLVEIDADGNAESDVTHPPTLDALLSSL